MTIHFWGDKEFDWGALNEACHFFATNVPRYGRMTCHTKEKYGTMRLEYMGMGFKGLYGLIYPNYLWFQWYDSLYIINEKIATITYFIGLSRAFRVYQRFIFNIVTIIAVKKWSHIQQEILHESEFDDLLYTRVKKYLNYETQWVTVKHIVTED